MAYRAHYAALNEEGLMKRDVSGRQTKARTRQILRARWFQPGMAAVGAALLITGSAYAASAATGPSVNPQDTSPVPSSDKPAAAEVEDTLPAASDNSAPQAAIPATDNQNSSSSTNNISRVEGSHTSISIESKSVTSANGESVTTKPEIKINGQLQQLPESGRFKQDIKTGDSRTRIRGNIDSENTSINISTKGSL